jgi:hypothetical protein
MSDGLYRVETETFVAGFVIEHGRVTRCAPILRRRLQFWIKNASRVTRAATQTRRILRANDRKAQAADHALRRDSGRLKINAL